MTAVTVDGSAGDDVTACDSIVAACVSTVVAAVAGVLRAMSQIYTLPSVDAPAAKAADGLRQAREKLVAV